MTDIRNYVEFTADFPDDIVFSEEGDIQVPGRRNVLNVLRDMLLRLGFEVSPIGQHSYYGWDMTVSDGKYKYWFMIQDPDACLLITEPRYRLFTRRSKAREGLHECLVQLNRELAEDRRFHEIRWYTSQEYNESAAGASAP